MGKKNNFFKVYVEFTESNFSKLLIIVKNIDYGAILKNRVVFGLVITPSKIFSTTFLSVTLLLDNNFFDQNFDFY